MAGIDEVKRSLAEWCSVAAERATETARVGSRRYDKFALGREIDRRYAELGAFVYGGVTAGRPEVLAEPRVAELVALLRELERERALKDEEIAGIRREYAGRRGEEGTAAGGSPRGPAEGSGGPGGDRDPDISD